MILREHFGDHVGALQSDGEGLARPVMPRAGIERPVWLDHRGGGEVEIAAAVGTLGGDGLDQPRGLANRFPVDAVLGRDHQAAVDFGVAKASMARSTAERFVVVGELHGAQVGRESELDREFGVLAQQRQARRRASSPWCSRRAAG